MELDLCFKLINSSLITINRLVRRDGVSEMNITGTLPPLLLMAKS